MATTAKSVEPHRAQWKTGWGFLLAAVGSAVGLGSIWRFSYVCYENGGGAFMIPYFVALVTAGIPLLMLEFGLGHRMRGSAPMAFAKISPHWEWLGWWMVTFVMFGIVLYYCVVIAWCVCYLWFALDLSWGTDPNTFFFKEFLGATAGPHVIGDIRSPILAGLLVVWVINWVIVYFGVEKGIERANKVFMPLLLILILVLVGWTATLPGAVEGMAVPATGLQPPGRGQGVGGRLHADLLYAEHRLRHHGDVRVVSTAEGGHQPECLSDGGLGHGDLRPPSD